MNWLTLRKPQQPSCGCRVKTMGALMVEDAAVVTTSTADSAMASETKKMVSVPTAAMATVMVGAAIICLIVGLHAGMMAVNVPSAAAIMVIAARVKL